MIEQYNRPQIALEISETRLFDLKSARRHLEHQFDHRPQYMAGQKS